MMAPLEGAPSWDEYFMGFAAQASTRGTCKRKRVGCVIVVERHVVATGYNGAPSGLPHCLEHGCITAQVAYPFLDGNGRALPSQDHCIRAVHAEANALLQAAKHGQAIGRDATLYTSASPCLACMMLIVAAGVRRVIYAEPYRLEMTEDLARSAGVHYDRILQR